MSDMNFNEIGDGHRYKILTSTSDFNQPPIQEHDDAEKTIVMDEEVPHIQANDIKKIDIMKDKIFNESVMFNTFNRTDIDNLDPKIGALFCRRDVNNEMNSGPGKEENIDNKSEILAFDSQEVKEISSENDKVNRIGLDVEGHPEIIFGTPSVSSCKKKGEVSKVIMQKRVVMVMVMSCRWLKMILM